MPRVPFWHRSQPTSTFSRRRHFHRATSNRPQSAAVPPSPPSYPLPRPRRPSRGCASAPLACGRGRWAPPRRRVASCRRMSAAHGTSDRGRDRVSGTHAIIAPRPAPSLPHPTSPYPLHHHRLRPAPPRRHSRPPFRGHLVGQRTACQLCDVTCDRARRRRTPEPLSSAATQCRMLVQRAVVVRARPFLLLWTARVLLCAFLHSTGHSVGCAPRPAPPCRQSHTPSPLPCPFLFIPNCAQNKKTVHRSYDESYDQNPPTPYLWQAPASTQKNKTETRPAIRHGGNPPPFFSRRACKINSQKAARAAQKKTGAKPRFLRLKKRPPSSVSSGQVWSDPRGTCDRAIGSEFDISPLREASAFGAGIDRRVVIEIVARAGLEFRSGGSGGETPKFVGRQWRCMYITCGDLPLQKPLFCLAIMWSRLLMNGSAVCCSRAPAHRHLDTTPTQNGDVPKSDDNSAQAQ